MDHDLIIYRIASRIYRPLLIFFIFSQIPNQVCAHIFEIIIIYFSGRRYPLKTWEQAIIFHSSYFDLFLIFSYVSAQPEWLTKILFRRTI